MERHHQRRMIDETRSSLSGGSGVRRTLSPALLQRQQQVAAAGCGRLWQPAALLVLLLLATTGARAHETGYYNFDSGAQGSRPSWMSTLCDTTLLSQLSLPGTHDTMSVTAGELFSLTQSMTLREQLDSGVSKAARGGGGHKFIRISACPYMGAIDAGTCMGI
jgi:hypothetical protein